MQVLICMHMPLVRCGLMSPCFAGGIEDNAVEGSLKLHLERSRTVV